MPSRLPSATRAGMVAFTFIGSYKFKSSFPLIHGHDCIRASRVFPLATPGRDAIQSRPQCSGGREAGICNHPSGASSREGRVCNPGIESLRLRNPRLSKMKPRFVGFHLLTTIEVRIVAEEQYALFGEVAAISDVNSRQLSNRRLSDQLS